MPMSAAERQRKRREKLRSQEPDKYEEIKKKHAEYMKNKRTLIGQLSSTEQSKKRKQWREANERRKNKTEGTVRNEEDQVPPNAGFERRYRAALKKIALMRESIGKLKRENNTLKKRVYRQQKQIDADEEIKKELEPIEELTIEEHFTTPSGSIDMDSCLKNIEDETIITIDGTKRDSVNTKGSNSDSDENNQQIKVEPSHCNTNENHLIGDIVSEINRNVLNILQVVNKEADEFETFGKYVAIVLRNLPPDVAATAKRELLATLANIQKKIYT
ncbi:uncharacterized protein LOC119832861 isoform X1 [Zerene cesonia]|uniref:uncharacterized protein LOC119832861 isoform X1 n=1 Tax=Zerene cesonia TaxID=33412 RepID=UPI0018E56878|nr:uncharacterized protein LOC119832861 isoform X1 [Zerene cesonia]